MIINAVLSHFDFVAKFTVKNLNKDFTNTIRGGGHPFWKVFRKKTFFFKGWLPLSLSSFHHDHDHDHEEHHHHEAGGEWPRDPLPVMGAT